MFFKKKKLADLDITPDEIFMDAKNMPGWERESFEGVMEKAITFKTPLLMAVFFGLLSLTLLSRVGYLDVVRGSDFADKAYVNRLRAVALKPARGVIYDRNGRELSWNSVVSSSAPPESNVAALGDGLVVEPVRVYASMPGLAHVLGYLGHVSDYSSELAGKAGVERQYDDVLAGETGSRLVEVDSKERVISASLQKPSKDGQSIVLTIDAELQSELFRILGSVIQDRGFNAGAGVVMDPRTGEVLAMTSWPEYDPNVLSQGDPAKVRSFMSDSKNPFFFRAISGLYAPGSIIKPVMALAALSEGVIDENRQIFSSGSISVPNPYNPKEPSIFYDWRPQGWVDLRHALAVSSNVYFYTVGGGFDDIGGLGVSRIGKYLKLFGLGSGTGIDLVPEAQGFVPNPEWKTQTLSDKIWRVGDTYNLSIGQGWLQVTPLQMASVVSAISQDGVRVRPFLVKAIKNSDGGTVDEAETQYGASIDIDRKYFTAVKEGMRMAASPGGTAAALSGLGINLAGKTGTAEIGKEFVNSWIISFAPYDKPALVMSIVLERGSVHNLVGAPFAARQLYEWMMVHRPEYLKNKN
ncbi:MAG: penicillin-binding transpeptidase domain-containing protein [Patescibacteria group bacterium]